jgi:hypothetical protein
MFEVQALKRIQSVKRSWQYRKLFSIWSISASIACCLIVLLHVFFGVSFWWLLLLLAGNFGVLFFIPSIWQFSEKEVVLYLNQNYSNLEESIDLVLLPVEQRSVLENLQVQKISPLFLDTQLQTPLKKEIHRSAWIFFGALILCISLLLFSITFKSNRDAVQIKTDKAKELILPEIKQVIIQISPPAYTGKASRTQTSFSILAEESSLIDWKIESTEPLDSMTFILNDSASYRFKTSGDNKTLWHLILPATVNGIYQIKLPNKVSEHYAIELIRDRIPMIQIQSPKQYTVIDFGELQQLDLVTDIKDDYAVVDANMIATVASGGGEAVKFKEHHFPLMNSGAAPFQQAQFKKRIDLRSLNMQPGDELYYYIKAIDNHQQEARSDIYILKLSDTAELKEMNGIVNAINVKPDYFRSQRQIIIETEQLLREQDTISIQQFKSRSNELGVDQKLLRLRYGKFLGEESEGNIGDSRFDTDDDHGAGSSAAFGDANAVIDAYSHKHDNAEDASFFDAETKKQLKAVLTEMWGSELKLRTFFPKDALPFEYKALRLLKELQQSSRAYVAKTNVKTTPLKFEKRLTGELTKILPQPLQFQMLKSTDIETEYRKTMGVLLTIRAHEIPDANTLAQMQVTLQSLNRLAIDKPSEYLLPYESFKRLYSDYQNQKEWNRGDWHASLAAIEKMLQIPGNKPGKQTGSAEKKLADTYFHHLNTQK